ncbi:unnamed protein product [Didymodactylos carnosus]|uniref:CSC1-like protein n=1 Tax=Didymodactylos carnosus TaxID=1234261 RepID=A0A814LZ48_9BILA|nr:unnamed protein product [Didymodactylos carnosus]CAF1072355.1 unnamed protein product [Didymodactylos carnosus]CAF3635402.1 unnamed protein product [Didymodactylos carnosus]CAF3839328.1 unnamed protein product [Didymodactylos carnosus]
MTLNQLIVDDASTAKQVSSQECSYLGRFNTTGFGLIRAYEGIPENLVVNLIVSAVQPNEQKFAHTTIANLRADSNLLWIHGVASIFFVLTGIFVAYLYTNATRYYAKEDLASRTLLIRGIPREACDEDKLTNYFKEAYPYYRITHLTLAYHIAQLQHLYKRREFYHRVLDASKKIYETTGRRPIVHNSKCGQICVLSECCAKEIDALEYYEKLYDDFKEKLIDEYEHVREKKIGIAFVSFDTAPQALTVYSDFRATCCARDRRPETSSSKAMKIHEWIVSYAPSPRNIIWRNIPLSEVSHWFRIIIVNIILMFFMIFLTTPSIVMSTIDKVANKYRSIDPLKSVTKQIQFPVFITSVMPVLLLRIFASAMPSLVSVTSLLEKQWKKSALDKSMMVKLFIFLCMMILILPSLGLTSIESFLRWVFETEGPPGKVTEKFRWMCVFLPDNGAFFVNYIITSAFIGAAIELLRLADLVYYLYIIATAKSIAERKVIRHALQFPFRFGVQYAWTSAVFCVIVAYAISCPLITPIGLIYMLIKRAVDKYNLVFVYDTEIADKSVHRLAGNFIIIALIIQQLTLLFFVLSQQPAGLQQLDEGGVSELAKADQKPSTSNYIPSVLTTLIDEFEGDGKTANRSSDHRYGSTDISDQPIIVGAEDENDLLTA